MRVRGLGFESRRLHFLNFTILLGTQTDRAVARVCQHQLSFLYLSAAFTLMYAAGVHYRIENSVGVIAFLCALMSCSNDNIWSGCGHYTGNECCRLCNKMLSRSREILVCVWSRFCPHAALSLCGGYNYDSTSSVQLLFKGHQGHSDATR